MRLNDGGDIGMREMRSARITYSPIHVGADRSLTRAGTISCVPYLCIAAEAGASARMRGSGWSVLKEWKRIRCATPRAAVNAHAVYGMRNINNIRNLRIKRACQLLALREREREGRMMGTYC